MSSFLGFPALKSPYPLFVGEEAELMLQEKENIESSNIEKLASEINLFFGIIRDDKEVTERNGKETTEKEKLICKNPLCSVVNPLQYVKKEGLCRPCFWYFNKNKKLPNRIYMNKSLKDRICKICLKTNSARFIQKTQTCDSCDRKLREQVKRDKKTELINNRF